ncbi:hypothetical protein [Siminovitchia sp. 179-K 8D1 HS]|uniref:hypothetical protein n=1 Tax=Siminovitchia sp. 179-K 8D1 HS TaxID=3142385 RepID=UPI0039A28A5E
MTFGYYLGISLIIWLVVGFTVGLKTVYIDKVLFKVDPNDYDEPYAIRDFIENQWLYIAICTLLGLIALIADLYGSSK